MDKEYFSFRCSQGHENRIAVDETDKYKKTSAQQIVVYCEQCDWSSPMPLPEIFQKQREKRLRETMRLMKNSLQESSRISATAISSPAPDTKKREADSSKASMRISASSITSAPPQPENRATEVKKVEPSDIEKSRARVKDTMRKTARISLESIQQAKQGESRQETPKPVPTVAKSSPPPKQSVETDHRLEDTKRRLRVTSRLSKKRILRETSRISKDSLDRDHPSGTTSSRVEAATKETKATGKTPVATPPMVVYQGNPRQPLLHFIWLAALGTLIFLAWRFFETQTDRVAKALYAVEDSVAKSPIGAGPKGQRNMGLLIRQLEALYEDHQKLADKVAEQQQQGSQQAGANFAEIKGKLEDFASRYQQMEQRLALVERELAGWRESTAALLRDYQSLKQKYDGQFAVTQLTEAEEDFIAPRLHKKSQALLFYRGQALANDKIQRHLMASSLVDGTLAPPIELFSTPPVRQRKGEVPFFVDWNREDKLVLLTRVEGLNTLYYFQLEIGKEGVRVIHTRPLFSVQYPQVLGPPSLSPDGKHVAFIHQDEEIELKILDIGSGQIIYSATGGADTLRAPCWNLDGSRVFYLTNDAMGIVAWQYPEGKEVKSLPRRVYGRYLSCSPDGRRIAFFQESTEGKGKVNLCIWNWQENSVEISQEHFMTEELSAPQWDPEGKYLAYIRADSVDRVILHDNSTQEIQTVFEKEGKLTWIDWNSHGELLFSYKEGLFARPYIVRFKK